MTSRRDDMSEPVLLDLFCCGGGATKGYQRAGFRVVCAPHAGTHRRRRHR